MLYMGCVLYICLEGFLVFVSVVHVLQFIFDAAAKFCVEIATHRHGCCVIQRCITHSTGKHRDKLITEISKNSILLAQDPFGYSIRNVLIS